MLVIECIMTASLLLLKRQERMRSIQLFERATYEHVSRCCTHHNSSLDAVCQLHARVIKSAPNEIFFNSSVILVPSW